MQKKYYRWLITKDREKLEQATKSKSSLLNSIALFLFFFEKLFLEFLFSVADPLAPAIMQLRKCCNHPYLFDGAEPMIDGEYQLGECVSQLILYISVLFHHFDRILLDSNFTCSHIIHNSGKLSLLDRLLPKLHKEGHKVLVPSSLHDILSPPLTVFPAR